MATEPLCDLCASSATSALKLSFPLGRKGVFDRLLGCREGAGLGEGDGGFQSGDDVVLYGLHPGVVEVALVSELPLELRDRITPHPRFALPRVARIGLSTALGVGAPAIGLALDHGWAFARARPIDGAVCRLI